MRLEAHLDQHQVELVQIALFATHSAFIRCDVDVDLDDEVADACELSQTLL